VREKVAEFKHGHTKKGGRVKGEPNKRTKELKEYLESIGCFPDEVLAQIVMGKPIKCRISFNEETGDFVEGDMLPKLEERMSAAKELMQYIYPKRKAVEVSGENGEKVMFVLAGLAPNQV
jgi:hypothetical protein